MVLSTQFIQQLEVIDLKKMNFGFLAILGIFCLSSVFFASVQASQIAIQPEKMINISQTEDTTVLIDRLLYCAYQRLGYKMILTVEGMNSALVSANSGYSDGFLANVPGIEKNYPNLIPVPEQFSFVEFMSLTQAGTTIPLKDWSDLSGKKVGFMQQRPFLETHVPRTADIKRYSSINELMAALKQGEIEIAITPLVGGAKPLVVDGTQANGVLERINSYSYVNKKHIDLVPKLSPVLQEMRADGTTEKIMSGEMTFNSSDNKVVLLISSYSGETNWEQTIADGLRENLSSNVPFELYQINLNSIRYGDNEYHWQIISNMIHKDFLDKNPDIVVTLDNEALSFVKKYYNSTFNQTPVVFSGVNQFTDHDLNGYEDNITGITEAIAAKETVTQMLTMFPNSKKIFVINDYTDSGKRWQADIQSQLESFKGTLNIEYNKNISFDELLKKIKSLPKDSLILSGFYYKDSTFKSFMQDDIQRQLYENASVPIFGLFPDSIGKGQLGGKYISALGQAKKTHDMMENIIMNKTISHNPIVMDTSDSSEWIFDYNILKAWNINESVLPKNSKLINKPLNIFQRNPFLVYLLGASAILIGVLVYVIRNQLRYSRELLATQKSLFSTEELLARDKALEEATEQLDALVSSAPVVFIVALDGAVVLANKHSKTKYGVNIGDRIENFYVEPSAREEFVRRVHELKKTSGETLWVKTISNEKRLLYGNFDVVEHNQAQPIAFWGFDITERENKTLLLKQLQTDLKSVLDTLPLGVYIYAQSSKKPLYANLAYAQIFCLDTGDDLQAFQAFDNPAADFTDTPDEILEYEYQFQFPNKDRDVVDAKVFASKIVYNDEAAILSIIRDVSADKKQTQMLEKIAAQEKEANKIKNNFIVSMSHEIRTPMNAVIGLTEIALTKNYEKEAAETFKKVNTSAKHLLNIISDALDFSKIEAEELALLEENFVLSDVLANASLVASQRIGDKRVEMHLDLDINLPNVLHGDKTRFWQVFKNLLDNSAKFTNTGRIVLSATSKDYKSGDQEVLITFKVSDTGFGMSQEQLDKLFVPFEQFHQNAKNSSTGTGLGMTISKQIVALMHGIILVDSEVNVGTTTTVVLPFKVVGHDATIESNIKNSGLAKCRILAADDDEISLKIINSLLSVLDCDITCVKSGEEALEKVSHSMKENNPYQVILLDYFMGGKNGMEVAWQLKSLVTQQTKILMVSAYATQFNASQIRDAGFDDIIEKPFSPTDFVQKISSALNVKQAVLAASRSSSFSRAKVMVVEDNEINQEVAISMLEVFGITPIVASNGQEALDLLEEQEFHLILMDIHMPVMNGHIATQTIRASKKPYANIPIVAMTANVVKEEIKKCVDEGMNGHISKPVDLNNLSSQLELWLSGYKDIVADLQKEAEEKVSITGIDMETAVKRFGGKEEKYHRLLKVFAHDCPAEVKPFEDAISEDNKAWTVHFIHTIKGVSGNLGITELYEAAIAFEASMKKDEPNESLYYAVFECYSIMKQRILETLK